MVCWNKKAEKEERKPNISKVILDALTEVYKKELDTRRNLPLHLCSPLFKHLSSKICGVFKNRFSKNSIYEKLTKYFPK